MDAGVVCDDVNGVDDNADADAGVDTYLYVCINVGN